MVNEKLLFVHTYAYVALKDIKKFYLCEHNIAFLCNILFSIQKEWSFFSFYTERTAEMSKNLAVKIIMQETQV